MWFISFFRVCLLTCFIISAWKWGDWENWEKYYSSILFVMVINLTTCFLLYHHSLWVFNPDAIVTTETVVELVSTYFVLPATTLMFLSNLPANGTIKQCMHILLWTLIYGALEWIDHNIIGGISYRNEWSYAASFLFDLNMFFTIRVHYARPLLGWMIALITMIIAAITLNFFSAEMK